MTLGDIIMVSIMAIIMIGLLLWSIVISVIEIRREIKQERLYKESLNNICELPSSIVLVGVDENENITLEQIRYGENKKLPNGSAGILNDAERI